MKEIDDLNIKYAGKTTFGINAMSDWSPKERGSLLGLTVPNITAALTGSANTSKSGSLGGRLLQVASQDFRTTGIVGAVKNQGQCGSCWAFSTTAVIESAHKVKYPASTILNLSEQELVSCDRRNSGCNGGWMTNAFRYVMKNAGLHSEANYPYTARKRSC